MDEKDTYKYHLKEGRRVLDRGITNDIRRTEWEHQGSNPNARIQQIGRRTTREAALRWRRQGGRRRYDA
jgi:hypothetical protein